MCSTNFLPALRPSTSLMAAGIGMTCGPGKNYKAFQREYAAAAKDDFSRKGHLAGNLRILSLAI
jgi:hypothetical protein